MPGLSSITWLIGYTLASAIAAVLSIRVLEFVTSPFFMVTSLWRRKRPPSSERGQ
jgi:hypothetical protein